ncbi:MAG: putative rane protein [Clostridiales bacterium]|jgi:putative membrane protein|nr:putative rane protein [Clostridiales bacterium]
MIGYGYGCGILGAGWIGMLVPIILIGIIIYAVIKLAHSNKSHYEGNYTDTDHAMAILNQRFANGEISEEEYTRKKETLRRY